MARLQIKLLIFLVALGIMLGVILTAYIAYRDVIVPDARLRESIASERGPGKPAPDIGARRFQAAAELLEQGRYDDARDALYKLLQQFPASRACDEARRIIGEMNMDALYKLDSSGGKQDYIVQPRDSLLGIVGKHRTTLEAITRFNALTSINLQPGEHLFVIPMEFDLAVDVSDRRVTLLRSGRFFKQYHATDVKLPSIMRVPVELQITSKSATLGGKAANPVSSDYVTADKRIVANRNATSSSAGIVLRCQPAAGEVADVGVFLTAEDIEELFPLLRKGSKFSLVQ